MINKSLEIQICNYKIFEKRVRRINMEEKWIKEMIDNDKWKFIM